jgi:hypothetical protein
MNLHSRLIAICLPLASLAFVGDVCAEPGDAGQIPQLASPNFGWQTNVADWQEAPAGMGHGPIAPDPAHPFLSNADANARGLQPTLRIGDTKDPVLKPWAAKLMQDSNEEALKGIHQVPFAAQARCWPGGVPGQLLFPFEPFYFVQTPKEVWMIWQRDHMVRRVFMTDKHSPNVKPSWFGESIGHYENGDTLVVDTIGLNDRTFVDGYRTPHTSKLHVIERFKITDGGKTLDASFVVDDPDTFNQPWGARRPRHLVTGREIPDEPCALNNDDKFDLGFDPVPTADHIDF